MVLKLAHIKILIKYYRNLDSGWNRATFSPFRDRLKTRTFYVEFACTGTSTGKGKSPCIFHLYSLDFAIIKEIYLVLKLACIKI